MHTHPQSNDIERVNKKKKNEKNQKTNSRTYIYS